MDLHSEKILVLDFGSQYTQLIARRLREMGVYCEIHPCTMKAEAIRAFGARGVVLSGGSASVPAEGSPRVDRIVFDLAAIPAGSEGTLSLGLIDTHSSLAPELDVRLNGTPVGHETLPRGGGDASIDGRLEQAKRHRVEYRLPAASLKPTHRLPSLVTTSACTALPGSGVSPGASHGVNSKPSKRTRPFIERGSWR